MSNTRIDYNHSSAKALAGRELPACHVPQIRAYKQRNTDYPVTANQCGDKYNLGVCVMPLYNVIHWLCFRKLNQCFFIFHLFEQIEDFFSELHCRTAYTTSTQSVTTGNTLSITSQ